MSGLAATVLLGLAGSVTAAPQPQDRLGRVMWHPGDRAVHVEDIQGDGYTFEAWLHGHGPTAHTAHTAGRVGL
ncbi:hypothetical protein ADL29_05205 [Streptomyces chattanoogensis]|uniref:Uncharacterized protein n=2 Tax=Streptomyces chattanoogensis TaxID=66876 RepID=A0A0N0XZH4_9ACTN|nr:hypothetical protein ADL29_05205 [Streptomyces chattanoogensis]